MKDPHTKKTRKSNMKIPKVHPAIACPKDSNAMWETIVVTSDDIKKIVKNKSLFTDTNEETLSKSAFLLSSGVNKFIMNWMLQKHDAAFVRREWARNIGNAAQTLLACLGVESADKWQPISDEVKNMLFKDGIYDLNPSYIQKNAGFPDESYLALERSAVGVYLIREMARTAILECENQIASDKRAKSEMQKRKSQLTKKGFNINCSPHAANMAMLLRFLL